MEQSQPIQQPHTPLTSVRNVGPAFAKALMKAGIDSQEMLINLGADNAYYQLLINGIAPHFIGYYSLVMGLMERPWFDCKGDEKAYLRRRFDAIKKQALHAKSIENNKAFLSRQLVFDLNILGVL